MGRRTIARLVTAAFLLACTTANSQQSDPAGTVVLSIVGTNDLHGAISPGRDNRGGLAWLGGYLTNLRAVRSRDRGGVLLVDAGDMFQGTLESNLAEGSPVVGAYNALGYAAAAVGNHEFDYGPVGPAPIPQSSSDDPRGALKARASEAAFPFLAANLIDASTGRPVDWPNVEPSVLGDVEGVKVGIIGVMTRDALTMTISANTKGLRIAPLAETIAAEAVRLRNMGASAIVVAAHAGGRCTRFDASGDTSSCDTTAAEVFNLIRDLKPGLVDVIVAGHTHAGIAHEFQNVGVIESFSSGRSFGRVDLMLDRTTKRVVGRRVFRPQNLEAGRYEGAPVVPDAAIAAFLEPALSRVRQLKSTPLGVVLDTPIRRGASVESALGNLFTDAFRESIPNADVAINNTIGGLRADLPAGPLTYGSLYEVFPFDNRMVQLPLTGAALRRLVTAQLTGNRIIAGISGIRVRAECSGATLNVTLTRMSGEPVRDAETLSIVTTDFLATGGDSIFAPVTPPGGFPVREDGPGARDLVADWLRRRGGSMREEQLVDRANPRWTMPGSPPISCGRP